MAERRQADIFAGEKPYCDLVMKGGITSGVVYPSAVLALAKRYRFCNIGGTSAGAIAAAATAAAEYRRFHGDTGGLRELEQVTEELKRPNFMLNLFQPTPAARPAFELLTSMPKKDNLVRGSLATARRVLASRRPVAVAAVLAWLAVLFLAIVSTTTLSLEVAIPVGVFAMLLSAAGLLIAALVVAAGLGAHSFVKSLPDNGYGICPGTPQPGQDEPALIEWLHARIQACAGRTESDAPLTFGDLEKADIHLRMITTDLSYARPTRVPFEPQEYMFDPDDLRPVLPGPVLEHLLASDETEPVRSEPGLRFLPSQDMPVLLGARLSLSFPLLLSAVRLRSRHPRQSDVVMENWLSDGGISSNFPIHLFDSWLPSHPTFGLDLGRYPDEAWEPGAPDVYFPSGDDKPAIPHWTKVGGVRDFLSQVVDALENWRDNMQADLPGFRDRIAQVRLGKTEGGMNLGMTKDAIEALIKRGKDAGEAIGRDFDWGQHRYIRYLTFMQMMEQGLHSVAEDERFPALAPELDRGLPGVEAYRAGHDAAWCADAAEESRRLLALAKAWGKPPAPIGFDRGDEPRPTPVMRITPRV